MKLAEFNDLCHREHARDSGVVTQVHLSPAALMELANDVIASPGDPAVSVQAESGLERISGPAGATIGAAVNPATQTLVTFVVVYGDEFAGTAEVTRWVPAGRPIPPNPATRDDLPPRDVAGYTAGG